MTGRDFTRHDNVIIPYQELLGNYDINRRRVNDVVIIPYQELLGNYDRFCKRGLGA